MVVNGLKQQLARLESNQEDLSSSIIKGNSKGFDEWSKSQKVARLKSRTVAMLAVLVFKCNVRI